jgi:hypothetical protein
MATAVRAVLAAAVAATAFGAAPAPAAEVPACTQDTVLTAVGVDTAAGTVLLAVPAADPGGGSTDRAWLIELAADGAAATFYPQPAGPPAFGGSVGPGPVFAVRSCGEDCLQAVRWGDGDWRPLGEPLRAPVAANVYPTYDRSGHPWLILQGARAGDREPAPGGDREAAPGGGPEAALGADAWGFRLDGREWTAAGHLAVTASGAAGAIPAPGDDGAVLSGSGRFAAGAAPATWLRGLPKVAAGVDGEVIPLAGDALAYLAGAGGVYLSRDDGATWARSAWTPWGVERTTPLFRPGSDYDVDLPVGAFGDALPLAWFDRRDRAHERLVLSAWSPGDGWRSLAELPAEVVTLDGRHLAFDQLFAPRPGSWLLLAGCVFTRTGPGLAVQNYAPGSGLSAPRFVELHPAGSGG